MAQVGLKNLYYATITEDSTTGNETFGTPSILAKAISAEISVESNEAILYADDGADVIVKEFKQGTIKLNLNELSKANAAALLGMTVDTNGVLVAASENASVPVAIGFQSASAKGGDKYYWLYRCTFAIPSDSLKTKGDGIEFATPTIEGVFTRRNKPDYAGKHPWKAEVKAGETGVAAATISGWFTAVYEPTNTPPSP